MDVAAAPGVRACGRFLVFLGTMECLSRRNGIVVLLFLLIVWINIQWIRVPVTVPAQAGLAAAPGFAPGGSAACVSCHREICSTHQATAHYLSSSPASAGLIKGSFKSGRNRIVYNEHMEVRLEKKGDHFFQTAYFNGTLYESESFDVVIGSGRKGQSFLY
jgi:hypothetical protein